MAALFKAQGCGPRGILKETPKKTCNHSRRQDVIYLDMPSSLNQETFEELACALAAGTLDASEAQSAEAIIAQRVLNFPEDRKLVADLAEVAAGLALAAAASVREKPSPGLKEQVWAMIERRAKSADASRFAGMAELVADSGEAVVLADADGRIQWVNEAFTHLCGYTLDELRGKKPGTMLQGDLTDPVAARRMSDAIRERQLCSEEILNYHKDGTPYWVTVTISPILDRDRRARGFVALERRLHDRPIPVAA